MPAGQGGWVVVYLVMLLLFLLCSEEKGQLQSPLCQELYVGVIVREVLGARIRNKKSSVHGVGPKKEKRIKACSDEVRPYLAVWRALALQVFFYGAPTYFRPHFVRDISLSVHSRSRNNYHDLYCGKGVSVSLPKERETGREKSTSRHTERGGGRITYLQRIYRGPTVLRDGVCLG